MCVANSEHSIKLEKELLPNSNKIFSCWGCCWTPYYDTSSVGIVCIVWKDYYGTRLISSHAAFAGSGYNNLADGWWRPLDVEGGQCRWWNHGGIGTKATEGHTGSDHDSTTPPSLHFKYRRMHTKVEDGTNTRFFGSNVSSIKWNLLRRFPTTSKLEELANVPFDAINTYKAVHNIQATAYLIRLHTTTNLDLCW